MLIPGRSPDSFGLKLLYGRHSVQDIWRDFRPQCALPGILVVGNFPVVSL